MNELKSQENPAYTFVLYDAISGTKSAVAYIPAFDRIVDYITLTQPHKPPCLDETSDKPKQLMGISRLSNARS
ncbi:hypothetical protein AC579_8002 [Pseudocercospora musae]|uniref:Uncharacterized protein n=1 Tax=Pseudocercospora musae TaxID=113226 RepID=A0A139I567_9PEZI|nr:hypothetical protein AC579_8002 [Pseudocercospora musae]